MSNRRYNIQTRKNFNLGGRAKLDADGDGKITGKDFAMLRGKKKDKKKKPSPMMLAMRDKRNMGASKALEKDQLKKQEEKFSEETKKFQKRAKEAKETPGTSDDGYKIDYSNIPRKPNLKFK